MSPLMKAPAASVWSCGWHHQHIVISLCSPAKGAAAEPPGLTCGTRTHSRPLETDGGTWQIASEEEEMEEEEDAKSHTRNGTESGSLSLRAGSAGELSAHLWLLSGE